MELLTVRTSGSLTLVPALGTLFLLLGCHVQLRDSFSFVLLCNMMSVSKSGYYKWKYRQENPSEKELSRQSDIRLIKEVHDKHPSHGYRSSLSFVSETLSCKYLGCGWITVVLHTKKVVVRGLLFMDL